MTYANLNNNTNIYSQNGRVQFDGFGHWSMSLGQVRREYGALLGRDPATLAQSTRDQLPAMQRAVDVAKTIRNDAK